MHTIINILLFCIIQYNTAELDNTNDADATAYEAILEHILTGYLMYSG